MQCSPANWERLLQCSSELTRVRIVADFLEDTVKRNRLGDPRSIVSMSRRGWGGLVQLGAEDLNRAEKIMRFRQAAWLQQLVVVVLCFVQFRLALELTF